MAAKFIELKQAAERLGVSPDELNEMRLRGEILAVRDGSVWKFKEDELLRVLDERGGAPDDLAHGAEESSDFALEVEQDDLSASPTEIGKSEDFAAGMAADAAVDLDQEGAGGKDAGPGSDLGFDLATDSDLQLKGKGGKGGKGKASDVELVPDASGSGLDLIAGKSDVLTGSDVVLDKGSTGGGTGELGFEGSDLELGSDLTLEGEDVSLEEDSEDELTLGKEGEEELALTDDDELVLDSGSDVTGGTGDTGINLASPSDSGLNLEEEPIELAGSSVSSLELPEEDELGGLDDLEGDDRLRADEDFQLEPSAGLAPDDEDSGSQVIALEDSEAFVEAGGLGEVDDAAVLEAEPDDGLGVSAPQAGAAASVPQPMAPVSGYTAAEKPYTVWNVLSLLGIVVLLMLTGMLMTDLVRNMWSWNQPFSASTPLMDAIVQMVGLDP